ncbi:MAG: DEAD/DEAH box helicase, partial [Baekduiaceae bacterium]
LEIPLGDKLYGFQRAFIDHAVERLRLVLADDMGLGKTVQALGTIAEYQARDDVGGPKLIVAPNSVKGAWKREIFKWLGADEQVFVVEGTPEKREDAIREAIAVDGWVIVNWEQLRVERKRVKTRNGGERTVTLMKQPLFETTPWLAIIADEAHRAKNRKASQSMGLHRLDANLMIAATGTPIMNSPDELWSLLKWMWPKEYTSYWRFYDQYVEYHESYYGKVITGVKNPDALRFELRDRLVRRTKDQVLDLPEKIRVTIPVELSKAQRALYVKAEKDMWLAVVKEAEEGSPTAVAMLKAGQSGDVTTMYRIPNGAARMVRQRQILESPALLEGKDDSAKLDACVERILDAVEHQHVVFCEFVETTAILAERLRAKGLEVATYTGSVKPAERTVIEDAFQNGEYSVIVGTIAAMKEGITLTAADVEHFISRSWVPATNEQAEDRCHRVGQDRAVVINIYEAEHTVDTLKVAPTNDLKDRIVRAVLPKDNVKEERND